MTFSKQTQALINKALEAKAAYEDIKSHANPGEWWTRGSSNLERAHVAYEDAREVAFRAVAEEVGVTL